MQPNQMPTTGSPSGLARVTRALARATAPLSRPLAGHRHFPLYALIRHRGRRSGRDYTVPVAVRVTADAFVIALPWGAETQWVRNVIAAGGCALRWRGEEHTAVDPTIIRGTEGSSAFNRLQQGLLRAAGVATFVHMRRSQPEAKPAL